MFRKTPLKAQNYYIYYNFGTRHGPFGPPMATPMLWPSPRKFSAYATGCFVRKVSCVLHKDCNCNKIMAVTFTANCYSFIAYFGLRFGLDWSFLGWFWACFMRTLSCFFNQHLATLVSVLLQVTRAPTEGFFHPDLFF